MKTSLFTFFASIALSASALASPPSNDTRIKMDLRDGYGLTVLRVQQYNNLMPVAVNPGESAPNPTVTLIDFVAYACRGLQAKDFEVVSQQSASAQIVQIRYVGPIGDCRAVPRRQELSISARDLSDIKPIVVVNPVEVTRLPDVH